MLWMRAAVARATFKDPTICLEPTYKHRRRTHELLLTVSEDWYKEYQSIERLGQQIFAFAARMSAT